MNRRLRRPLQRRSPSSLQIVPAVSPCLPLQPSTDRSRIRARNTFQGDEKMKFLKCAVSACLCLICVLFAAALWADEPNDKSIEKNPAFGAISALGGTWVAVGAPQGQKPMTLVFKPTAGGSAIIETMFPGSDREMVNVYSIDGGGV